MMISWSWFWRWMLWLIPKRDMHEEIVRSHTALAHYQSLIQISWHIVVSLERQNTSFNLLQIQTWLSFANPVKQASTKANANKRLDNRSFPLCKRFPIHTCTKLTLKLLKYCVHYAPCFPSFCTYLYCLQRRATNSNFLQIQQDFVLQMSNCTMQICQALSHRHLFHTLLNYMKCKACHLPMKMWGKVWIIIPFYMCSSKFFILILYLRLRHLNLTSKNFLRQLYELKLWG